MVDLDAERGVAIDVMRQRYSCRTFDGQPLEAAAQTALASHLAAAEAGPFGHTPRMKLLAATPGDQGDVRKLGTYGFIQGAPAYVAGVVRSVDERGVLEDLGYVMEAVVLHATQLGLGTVWLGGTFTKGRFARALGLGGSESLPAVIAVGRPAGRARAADAVIRRSGLIGLMTGPLVNFP